MCIFSGPKIETPVTPVAPPPPPAPVTPQAVAGAATTNPNTPQSVARTGLNAVTIQKTSDANQPANGLVIPGVIGTASVPWTKGVTTP